VLREAHCVILFCQRRWRTGTQVAQQTSSASSRPGRFVNRLRTSFHDHLPDERQIRDSVSAPIQLVPYSRYESYGASQAALKSHVTPAAETERAQA
jgi:hypothetical protein